ncbi:MAG: hypothetical protein KH846_08470 [Leptotrichia wadei]|uniref:hypothetical protein n=1 Tax=Leptotrichia wadei TaxID=157687 RepID=UPI0026EE273A|nr:hypothetical protein [Leptotrichia wadei]MBS6020206.1 hypothetical protein [Leptotrichia wadei]
MSEFSDVKSSNDAGVETKEVENPNSDFGDGDGVNEFDDTYKRMSENNEIMEYSEKTSDINTDKDDGKKKISDMTTEEYEDYIFSDFNDSKDSIPENNTADVDSSQNDSDISNYKKDVTESGEENLSENDEIKRGIKNTERDENGNELSEEVKQVNEKFRGDKFDENDSFEATLDDVEKKRLIDLNASTTCGLNENLDGKLDGSKFANIDKSSLIETRKSVEEITPDTVMQKVISYDQSENYLKGKFVDVRHCCSKASDTAPYVSCGSDAYKELRLDYENNDALRKLENNSEMYVIRFTSNTPSSEIGIPNAPHPCTGTGFTGSNEHLIPEYEYPETKPTDGAIYKIDAEGNETIIGIWDDEIPRFIRVSDKKDRE